MKSRLADCDLKELFSLGNLYISDFVKEQPDDSLKSELKLMFCSESKVVQLEKGVDSHKMYGKYWYRSGTNETMRKQLKDVVDNCLYVKSKTKKGLWLDIACNDGTLLSYVPDNFKKIGIDPCDNSYAIESVKYADEIIQDFFDIEAFNRTQFKGQQCDVITCVAMFYDLDNPYAFLNDVYAVLKDDGLFVLQMSYTPLMIKQMAFDNICHEHLMYYSLYSLKYVLEKANFQVVDCELNDVNGGSFRIYCQKDIAPSNSFAHAAYRDVASFRVNSILEYEKLIGANTEKFYLDFFDEVRQLKTSMDITIKAIKAQGKTIGAYGASTKGNTLLQYFGLDKNIISYAVERSPYKFGLKTIGTDIPIISEDEMRQNPPDYLLVLPWHFIDEFKQREKTYLDNGGAFIVPCPNLLIIRGK